ncbi:MAG: GTP diphosphokinase [Pseudomonadota bacterium]
MVQVTSTFPALPADHPDPQRWLDAITAGRSEAEAGLIRRAWTLAESSHAGQTRASGEPYVSHARAVASILAELRLDAESIAAAILHDVAEDTDTTLDDIRAQFGPGVAALVDGVTKLDVLPELHRDLAASRAGHAQAESLRKMLLAMAEDVRVVLIKLADRLHNMRTLSALPADRQQRIARETMDILAPLANRLGIWQIKWELEDLAFRYLEPEAYRQLAASLAERRIDREAYLERFVARLSGELAAAGIKADINSRVKHIYSIWRKMQRKHIGFGDIFDVRAVRLLVDSVRDCYAALGIVHSLWPHVPGEFDDYIATPKENNYRSIHTAVVGPEGKTVEVQIRSHEMHNQSELGVAAHWRYKEGARQDRDFDDKITWLRSLLEWKDEVAEASDFVDQFKSEVFSERVYVFTPKGRIVDLPVGATPLDFAYHIHTDVGHRCRGAKVNGQMVPLTYALKTGERVEVLTAKTGGPSRDWLSLHHGYLHTSKARQKAAAWFRLQEQGAAITAGRAELDRELDRLGVSNVKLETLAQRLNFARADDLLAAVGRDEVKSTQIANALLEAPAPPTPPAPRPSPISAKPGEVSVQGVGRLLTRMARCCNPVPGDAIVGFITRGQGVTVHRRECPNALRHRDEHEERLIEVSWGAESPGAYPADIEVTAWDRSGLLRDITALLANERINVRSVSTQTDRQNVAHMVFTVEIADLGSLSRVLDLIDRLPNVSRVRRKTG